MNYRKTFSLFTLIAWRALFLVSVIWLIAPNISEAQLFYPAVNYGAGEAPYSVAIGDLNGDGDLDLAVANYMSDDISILINTGGVAFVDVPPGYWAENAIYKIYNVGITTGCSKDPLMFCPEKTVNREQMAVFLGRAKHGSKFKPPAATGIFADVPKWYWAADWIEQFYADGLTKGCKTDPHDAQSPVMYYCPKYCNPHHHGDFSVKSQARGQLPTTACYRHL